MGLMIFHCSFLKSKVIFHTLFRKGNLNLSHILRSGHPVYGYWGRHFHLGRFILILQLAGPGNSILACLGILTLQDDITVYPKSI